MKRLFVGLLAVLFISVGFSHAQDDIVLTVHFVNGMEYLEDAQLFEAFEQAHNVQINVLYADFDQIRITPPTISLEEHLRGQDNYTQSADVLLVSAGEGFPTAITLEATRAGYYLDLNPLLQIDEDFDPSVYYPAVWQSALWDGGAWLLPLTAQIYTVIYDPEIFDSAGLAYPTPEWTLTDWAHAIEALTPRDDDGNALRPGYIGFNRSDNALMHALLNAGVMDTSILPHMPQFTRPDLLSFAEVWAPLYHSGAIYSPNYSYAEDFSPSAVPLTTSRIQSIDFTAVSTALLPGERAGVSITGLAVSNRTEHPELAYALAHYLAADSRVADAVQTMFTFVRRARPAYDDVIAINNAPYSMTQLTAEEEALIDVALENAIPASELHFFDTFKIALQEETDVAVALQNAEALARQTLEQISGTAPSASIATPVPTAVLNTGEIALRFHRQGILNQESWDDFARQFVENDPQVAEIILDERTLPMERITDEMDCFYQPENTSLTANAVLNLDPLISADANFDAANFLPGVLDRVRVDNQIRAYPLTVDPLLIWSDNGVFDGSMAEFMNILTQSEEQPVLASMDSGETLLMLIAANGGLPIDLRTTPPQLDFAGNIAPIREVLDLARDGVIFYPPLSTWENVTPNTRPSIYAMRLSWANGTGAQPALFPQGADYAPVSYDLSVAYITRQTLHPEACYRFITALAQRPDLLNGLPAQRLPDHDLYDALETTLASPNALTFPSRAFVVTYWLYRAFDRYVLEGADLETELIEAERLTRDYLTCAEGVETDHGREPINCALQIDPTSAAYFTLDGALGD